MGTGLAPLALALIAFCTATPPLAAAQAPPPPPLSPIRSSDRSIHFFDAHGRVRIFHGAARVQKKPPWYFPDLLEGDTEARAMEALGFNVLRLGFMWSGYNPAPGEYNRSYVEVIKTTVAQLNAHGVYVLLDMHQDILSSAFCLYDGAPRWVRLSLLERTAATTVVATVLDRCETGPLSFGAACWIPGVETERTAKERRKNEPKWAR